MGSEFALNFIYLLSLGSTSLYHLELVRLFRLMEWIVEFFKINDGSKINKTKQKPVPVTTGQKDSQFGCMFCVFYMKRKLTKILEKLLL